MRTQFLSTVLVLLDLVNHQCTWYVTPYVTHTGFEISDVHAINVTRRYCSIEFLGGTGVVENKRKIQVPGGLL